jgi:hypothetical protein
VIGHALQVFGGIRLSVPAFQRETCCCVILVPQSAPLGRD